MKGKLVILILIFTVIIVGGCAPSNDQQNKIDVSKLNMDLERQIALTKAQILFNQAKADDLDMSQGPCLSNELYGNPEYPETMWVLDIAHNPRQEIDNLPENQCSAFREGKAKHFIEMDTDGEIIKIYQE
ncbi:hypothetical protein KKF32_00600 [Patescibacteria group bacterium]|nr:hypothetical protein [Patescibacteria group bacterium]